VLQLLVLQPLVLQPLVLQPLVLQPLEHPRLELQALRPLVLYQPFPEEPIFYTPHHIPAP
jgi:hypothetical protein